MNNNEIIITGSLNGIKGDLFKRGFLLILYSLIFLTTKLYSKSFYSHNEIKSTLSFLSEKIIKLEFQDVLPLVFIILIFIFLAIFTFSSLLKTVKLFYNINKKVTVDFFEGKLVIISHSFPFTKSVEQNKFDSIITVNIEQGFIDKFFNSGRLYVEYLVSSKVDSHSVSFEIPHVYRPSKALKELLR